jgi:hypothetical protein
MIFSTFFYRYRFSDGISITNERHLNRAFYPLKYFDTFPLWYQYLRKNNPYERIVIFDTGESPISIKEGLKYITEPYEFIEKNSYIYNPNIKFHIKKMMKSEIVKQTESTAILEYCFNLLNAFSFAYYTDNDCFWMDMDALCNSSLEKYVKGYDIFSPSVDHMLGSLQSWFIFISKQKLHQNDHLYCLPKLLLDIVIKSYDELRMALFFETGIYKLFCNGNYNTNQKINLIHLGDLDGCTTFLTKNFLDSQEYKEVLSLFKKTSKENEIKENNLKFGGVLGSAFGDIIYEE